MPVIFINVFLAATERSNNLLHGIYNQRNSTRYDISDDDLLSKLYMYDIICMMRRKKCENILYFDNCRYLCTGAKNEHCKYESVKLF